MIKNDLIDYIVVDRRLSRALPVLGYYFESRRGRRFSRRSRSAASPDEVPPRAHGLSRIYVNGADHHLRHLGTELGEMKSAGAA